MESCSFPMMSHQRYPDQNHLQQHVCVKLQTRHQTSAAEHLRNVKYVPVSNRKFVYLQ